MTATLCADDKATWNALVTSEETAKLYIAGTTDEEKFQKAGAEGM